MGAPGVVSPRGAPPSNVVLTGDMGISGPMPGMRPLGSAGHAPSSPGYAFAGAGGPPASAGASALAFPSTLQAGAPVSAGYAGAPLTAYAAPLPAAMAASGYGAPANAQYGPAKTGLGLGAWLGISAALLVVLSGIVGVVVLGIFASSGKSSGSTSPVAPPVAEGEKSNPPALSPGPSPSLVATAASPLPSSAPAPSSSSRSAKLGPSALDAPKPSSISTARDNFTTGESAFVRFNHPPRKEDEKYWLTVVPVGTPDDRWDDDNWHFVQPGVSTDSIRLTKPGISEIRLHDQYSRFTTHLVARKRITVTPPAAAPSSGGSGTLKRPSPASGF